MQIRFTSEAAGSTNTFGDHQLDVDLKTDAIIFDALRASGVVSSAASEENPKVCTEYIYCTYFTFMSFLIL